MKTVVLTLMATSLAVALILYPKDALSASLRGLDIWWEIVFPSLLPFFITAEFLIGFGVVHGLGALSERFMRPLFNVPGCGGFVWVMGMASGYPAGAKWTADLRKKGEVTRVEAERLVAFTNASSPLFLFGAIAVGFFHDANLGVLLAASHYGGNMLVGIGMRFYGRNDREQRSMERKSSTWKDAFWKMHHSRLKDGRSFGRLMGDAVTRSVDTLLMVGGFIMLFSVLTELLKQTGAIHIFTHILAWTGLPDAFQVPFAAGMLELTTGVGAVTDTHEPLLAQLLVVSFILGFHGFSIQAQIASILSETDIRFQPYALARIAHGVLATVLMFIFYAFYVRSPFQTQSLPIWNPDERFTLPILEFFHEYGPPITMIAILFMIAVKWTKKRQSASS
ncbi:hypothetical protein D479_16729 [Halobacillus sp. BAB-2008]|nr:hypothetical protein D479_16729 [Halobacillus sp. BAB-2008]